MKNLFLLPTEKPSRLCIDNSCDELNYCDVEGLSTKHTTNQNIYITSSEQIKDGDYVIENNRAKKQPYIGKCFYPENDGTITDEVLKRELLSVDYKGHYSTLAHEGNCKKIILTTDADLIADGVQEINDNFLEWFVENPSCESVEVESMGFNEVDCIIYKIIIPQEKPKTNLEILPFPELVENAARYVRGWGEDDDEKSFIAGANWYKQNYNNWFDYSVTKPPIGVEVLAQSGNWINEDYNIRGIRIGFQNEDENGPFVSAKWDNSGDIYEDCEEYKPTKWKFIN
jgi:hypothetical protein